MKLFTNEKGFTLIEMMIVLLIISVLVLIAIPNVARHSSSIDEKGCEAYINTIVDKHSLSKMQSYQGFGGCAEMS